MLNAFRECEHQLLTVNPHSNYTLASKKWDERPPRSGDDERIRWMSEMYTEHP